MAIKRFGLLALAGALAMVATPSFAQSGEWRSAAGLVQPRSGLAAAALDGRVYAIGGEGLVAPHADVEVYDFDFDLWRAQTPLPEGRAQFGLAAFGGQLYVVGGQSEDLGALAEVLALSSAGGQFERWTPVAELPSPRAGHGVAVAGDFLFAVAGSAEGIDRYDPVANVWERSAAPREVARVGAAVVGLGDEVFVLGGVINGAATARVDIYDTTSETWSRGPDLPAPRRGMGAVVMDNTVHIIGGGDAMGRNVTADHFALIDGAWRRQGSLPGPRVNLAAVFARDQIVVVGGGLGGGFLASFTATDQVDIFRPAASGASATP